MVSKFDELVASRPKGYFANRGFVLLNLMLLIAQISSYATGYDASMMNGLQSLTYWQDYFGTPTGSVLGVFNCINSVGQLASFPFQAWCADRFGRRVGMAIGAVILLVGCVLQGAAKNIGMFIAARGIMGFGIAINITAAPVYLLETAYPAHRGPLTALYNSLWSLGSLAASWITYGTFTINNDYSWRIPSYLQGLSSVIQLVFLFFLPESPRWLLEHGHTQRAVDVLVKYHANGDSADPLVELEIAEIEQAIAVDREINQSVSWFTMFKTSANLKRTLLICSVGVFSQTQGGSVTSYYLSLILESIGYTDSKQQLTINGILQAYGLVLGIIGALVVNYFPRRFLFNLSTIGNFVTFIVWAACEATYEKTANAAAGRAVLACIFIISFWAAAGWTPLQVVYCIEILPIAIRARGLAVYNISVAISGIVGQYLVPVMIAGIAWKTYIVYVAWMLIIVLVVWFCYPETRGMSLEETSAMFDGEAVVDKIAHDAEGAAGLASPNVENKEAEAVAVPVLEKV
ncbi:hypothetical protein Q5752_002698 [Cryptotrichosporon argae]